VCTGAKYQVPARDFFIGGERLLRALTESERRLLDEVLRLLLLLPTEMGSTLVAVGLVADLWSDS
jgi:hypothetical protein